MAETRNPFQMSLLEWNVVFNPILDQMRDIAGGDTIEQREQITRNLWYLLKVQPDHPSTADDIFFWRKILNTGGVIILVAIPDRLGKYRPVVRFRTGSRESLLCDLNEFLTMEANKIMDKLIGDMAETADQFTGQYFDLWELDEEVRNGYL